MASANPTDRPAVTATGVVPAAQVRCIDWADLSALPWDAWVGPQDPFLEQGFLQALAESGSIGGDSGWEPVPLVAERAGRPCGGVLAFRKRHSWGEYVFDQEWAQAWAAAGLAYYPKWTVAAPLTPVSGPRLLTAPDDPDPAGLRAGLAAALLAEAEAEGASGVHVLLPAEFERPALREAGFLERQAWQYHWTNPGYHNFADYLAGLRSAKRRQIRREREAVRAAGIGIEVLRGADLDAETMRFVGACYFETHRRRGARPWLQPGWFEAILERQRERLLVVLARRAGRPVAAALHFVKSGCLYGRYWGSFEPVPFLHFECAYYAAIEWGIAHGIERIEAGAQGEHKFLRGYDVSPVVSAHQLFHPGGRAAVARFLGQEGPRVEARARVLQGLSPRKAGRRAASGETPAAEPEAGAVS